MNGEYQTDTDETKPAGGPENGPAERKPVAKRVSKARRGYRPHPRNDLYRLAGEFKKRHPTATGAQAWAHFTGLAGMSAVIIAYSAALDVLEYAPDTERWRSRRIKRLSFLRRYSELATD